MTRILAFASVLLLIGCGDVPTSPNPIDLGDAGVGPGDGGGADLALADGPMFEGDLGSDPGGPTIKVVSPAPGGNVAYDTLRVRAEIVAMAGATLDASSVKVLIPGANGSTVSADLSLTATPNTYEGQIDISGIPAGPSEFAVTAADTMARRSTVKVDYKHDRGPQVTIMRPSKATAKGSLTVEVEVHDPLYPITAVGQLKVLIRSSAVTMTQVEGAVPFRAVGDFSFDATFFGPQLLTVEATNSEGTVGKATKQFTIDNKGPEITFVKPVAGEFVGGVTEIRARIVDADGSGIDESSVRVVFGHDQTKTAVLKRVSAASDEFSTLYDIGKLSEDFVSPAVSIRAADTLGNDGEEGIQVIVDNTRPRIELDPPPIRLAKIQNGIAMCSVAFDPVGDESANDGETVRQLVSIKARIEDAGNRGPGLAVERFAGVDPSSVTLYALPAGGGNALIVDTTGDDKCDDINPLLLPRAAVTASNEVLALAMTPLAEGGVPDYSQFQAPAPQPWLGLGCQQLGDGQPVVPRTLCKPTSLTIALPWVEPQSPIYTLPPVGSDLDCVGLQLDTLNALPEGPLCVVVRAVDKVGNVNVSPPLRLCVKRSSDYTGCDAWTLPDCTGTYLAASNTVDTSAPCVPYTHANTFDPQIVYDTRFPANEVRLVD